MAIGVLQRDGATHVVLTLGDALGTSGHRIAANDVSPVLFERGYTGFLTQRDLEANQIGRAHV